MLKTNPYYNRKLIKTTHATYLDSDSLYKMGQLTKEQLMKEKETVDNKKIVTTTRFFNKTRNRFSLVDGINSYTTSNLEDFMKKRGHRRQS